jgi:hypothetical protein
MSIEKILKMSDDEKIEYTINKKKCEIIRQLLEFKEFNFNTDMCGSNSNNNGKNNNNLFSSSPSSTISKN